MNILVFKPGIRSVEYAFLGAATGQAHNGAMGTSSLAQHLAGLCETLARGGPVGMPDALAIHEQAAARRRLLCGHRGLLDEGATQALFAALPAPSAADWEQAWAHADRGELVVAARLFARHAVLRRWHLARPHKPKLLGCHFSLFREDVERVTGSTRTSWGGATRTTISRGAFTGPGWSRRV